MSILNIERDVVSGAFERPAWHGRGTVFGRALTRDEAITAGGLDWTVEKEPIYVGGEVYPDKVATVRSDTGQALGIVGKRYQPIQNAEAFDAASDILDDPDIAIRAAVVLEDSKAVAITCKPSEDIVIDPEGIADVTEMNLFISTRHDGQGSLTIGLDPTTIVCMNTNQIAIEGAKQINRLMKIQHRANAKVNVSTARDILGITFAYSEEYAKMMNEFTRFEVSDSQWQAFVDTYFAPEAKDTAPASVQQNSEDKREIMDAIWNGRPTADGRATFNGRSGKTAYGVLQAVTEYGDWFAPTKGKTAEADAEIRLERIASSALQKPTMAVVRMLNRSIGQAKDARRSELTLV